MKPFTIDFKIEFHHCFFVAAVQQLLDLIGLAEFPMNGVAFTTRPDWFGTRGRVYPVAGTRIAEDASAQATMVAPGEEREACGAILTLMDQSVADPVIRCLNPQQMNQLIATLPQMIFIPAIHIIST